LIGPPGSGKSTFINELKTKFNDIAIDNFINPETDIAIHSTDDKFINKGIYKYQRDKLNDFHALVQKEALMNMQKGTKIIALDNTNLEIGNFSYSGPYPEKNKFTNFAIENGYTLHFIFFLTNPNTIYGEKGVSSEARIKSGKAFFGDTGKTTVYNFLYKYLSKGFIELLGGIQKFDKQ
jgi:predicted kinase